MARNRFLLILIFLITCFTSCVAQQKLLKRSWIKHSIQELGQAQQHSDSSYLRYVFDKSQVLFGFDPAWHSMAMPFTLERKAVTIGFDRWAIEELSDSTLTIFLPGFRRMKFYAEEYIQAKYKNILQVGEYNGKPLYKADQIITPRYKKPVPLSDDISTQDRAGDYNIRKAGIFQMSFIVTDEGKIEEPKIIKGVAPGYDANIINELVKTSRQWDPATLKGKPVQTLMMFEIKFLDSLDQR